MTVLIGRADALRRACELLEGARLVTVAGPGGVGKTRLAVEAASAVAAACETAGFVDGARLRRPEQLLPLAPLGVPGSRTASPLAVADSPAVSLLVERVRAVVPGFELTGDNARDVADLHHLGRPAPGPGAGGAPCAHPRAGRGADPQPSPV